MKFTMNYKIFTLVVLLLSGTTSCISTFYQVYKAAPANKATLKDNLMVFEDDNCKITYDFWKEKGDIGFSFYNKTDKNIYLDLGECFFVHNSIAHNYFQNRTYFQSAGKAMNLARSSGIARSETGVNNPETRTARKVQGPGSIGALTASGISTSYAEERIVCIPPDASKLFREYSINDQVIRDCDLYRYPKRTQIKTISYTVSDSPIIFGNKITYRLAGSDKAVMLDHEFYVWEITNYPENEIMEYKSIDFCGQKSSVRERTIKDSSPYKFYLRYTKGQNLGKF
jgi:hypothetical protein